MEKLNRQVRKAQRWLGLQRFVGVVGWCCFVALLIALAVIVLDKFRPLGVEAWVQRGAALGGVGQLEPRVVEMLKACIWAGAALMLGVSAAIFYALIRGRGPIDAAIEIDRRFGLKERVSSAMAMSEEERESPLGQALADDAARRVGRIDVGEHFGISPGRQILLPLIPGVIAILVAIFVGPLGSNQAQATTDSGHTKQIEKSSDSLRQKLVEQRKRAGERGLEDAQDLFERLEEEADDLATRSKGDRKQALVKLNDLSRQVKQRRDELGGTEQIRKQLGQLKRIEEGPADEFLKAVRQGDFNKALEELKQLKSKLAEAKLSDEQKEKLARQLEQMQQKLEKLAAAQREAEQDLERRIQQARQAGRQGEADELQEQLDQLRQQRPQMDQLQNMANKMGQCAQCLRDGQLKDAGNMLDGLQADLQDLESQLQELEMLDEALGQLGQCRDQMNCRKCGGAGCQACQGPPGVGLGRGQGKGPRPEAEDTIDFIETTPPMKVDRGSASLVGEAEGPILKGDVQTQMNAQIQAARTQSADPVTIQHLPREYQQHFREYQNRLREGD